MHYFNFHIGDYSLATKHLDPIEDLAYRRLLDLYYTNEQPLNECSTTVARLINLRSYEAQVEMVLKEFFLLEKGVGWRNKRADDEIAQYHLRLSTASKAGKASAQRRSNARSTTVEPQLNDRSTTVQLTKNQEPITNNQEKSISRARGARSHQIPEGFVPNDKGLAFARDRGLDWDRTLEEFRDYHVAKASKFSDWDAAWRTWCRKAAQFKAAKAVPAKAQKVEDAWWATERGTEMKARELGLWPARNGESWDGLRARIRARIKDGDAGGDNALAQLLGVQA